ncbi:MAG: hypothetical protein PHS44_04545 [Candidatus Dojkabacteria bacterium]|nr:hypothetical protein [Candidatus Dojkabacteria bacterium]
MRTGVKLPDFLKKSLNIYSVVTLGLGIIVVVLVNSPFYRNLVGDADAYKYGNWGDIIHVCGAQPGNPPESVWQTRECDTAVPNCDFCHDRGCHAFAPTTAGHSECQKGCYVQASLCLKGQEHNDYECRNEEHTDCCFETIAYDTYFNNGIDPKTNIRRDCFMIQLDSVCASGPNNYSVKDFVVWKGYLFGDITCSRSFGGCPYPETSAQVKTPSGNWMKDLTISEGEDFQIGSFHTVGGALESASDTRLDLTGPDNFSFSCDTNKQGCHGWQLNDSKIGTYTLTVRTYNESGGFYPEAACNDTATVTVNVIPGDECPYNSTQARVAEGMNGAWASSVTLEEGDKFRIASFHNDTGNFAVDTNLTLSDPSGSTVVDCNGDIKGCNGKLVDAALVGTYLLTVKTYTKDRSTFYPEPECNDMAYAYVEVVPEESDFEVKKIDQKEDNGQPDTYVWGEDVKFNITVTNTGDTVLGQVFPIKFVDSYNHSHLEYLQFSKAVRQKKDSSGNWMTVQKGAGKVNDAAYIDTNGDIVVDDLSEHLGNLDVGERYLLVLKFKAVYKGNITTDNYVLVTNGDQKDDDRDKIKIIYNPPPPTDK